MKAKELRFRAWDRVESEMIYFELNDDINFGEMPELGLVLMQGSGILDKNGNEIYDSDLLLDALGTTFRIFHVPGGFIFKASIWKKDLSELNPSDVLIYEPMTNPQNKAYLSNSCQVIGNIYTNPELLYFN